MSKPIPLFAFAFAAYEATRVSPSSRGDGPSYAAKGRIQERPGRVCLHPLVANETDPAPGRENNNPDRRI